MDESDVVIARFEATLDLLDLGANGELHQKVAARRFAGSSALDALEGH
jgi:hypothetical protein